MEKNKFLVSAMTKSVHVNVYIKLQEVAKNMATKKTITREIPYHHRDSADWLTIEICNEYRRKAEKISANNIAAKRELQMELQSRCDITELQAINIINGYNAMDYVVHYERMRNHETIEVIDPEYLEWLAFKEMEEQSKLLGEFGIEERD